MDARTMEKPYISFNELTQGMDYDAEIEHALRSRFRAQGQLKLLICELYFLGKLYRRNVLDNSIIVYIGSAPGTHIRYLYEYFKELGANIRWVLVDSRDHDPILNNLPRMTIVSQNADKRYLYSLKTSLRNSRIVLISDVRSKSTDGEPRSSDLLRDYELQQLMITILKPVAASLKWRCPFPTEWINDFKILCGKEILQPFAPTFSAELRILAILSSEPVFRSVTIEDAYDYEKKMFYFNHTIRNAIIVNFDYPNQEYDFFHMFFLLNTVPCVREFDTPKKKVLFLHQSIFRFLNIRTPITDRLRNEPTQRGVSRKNTLPKGRDKQKSIRDNRKRHNRNV